MRGLVDQRRGKSPDNMLHEHTIEDGGIFKRFLFNFQEAAVYVFGRKSGMGMWDADILRILMWEVMVYKGPGGDVERKHTQQHDSQ
jgi:hypothetical protein